MFRLPLVASLLLWSAVVHGADAAPIPVATINVGKVFKECESFTARMEGMKKAVAEVEQSLRLKKAEIDRLQGLIAQADLNEQETLKTLQEQLATQQVAYQTEATKTKEFYLNEEAALYSRTYDAVREEVAKICKERNIRLVIKTNHGDPETNKRDDILQRVNRVIVFEDDVDITDDVIKAVNSRPK